jgi:hypothetical protein
MEYYHDQHIGVYKNAFPDEWCDRVIDYFESNPEHSHRNPRNVGYVVDEDGHLFDEKLRNEFDQYWSPCFNLYHAKYTIYPLPISLTGWKIQKTLPTEGYHVFHSEQGDDLQSANRVGVWTIYLNDIELGGETEYLHQLMRVQPQKGTLCIFPASYTHMHRGNTPFSGAKYIMTGWFEPTHIKKHRS